MKIDLKKLEKEVRAIETKKARIFFFETSDDFKIKVILDIIEFQIFDNGPDCWPEMRDKGCFIKSGFAAHIRNAIKNNEKECCSYHVEPVADEYDYEDAEFEKR